MTGIKDGMGYKAKSPGDYYVYHYKSEKPNTLEHFIHFPCNAVKGFAPISFGHEPNMLLFTLNRTSITRTETVKFADI